MTATNSPPKTYVDEFNQARAAAGLPPSVDAEGLRTSVFTFSTLMTASSVCMNITFACLLASSMWAKVLLASAYLAADIFKISAPSLTRYFWMRGNHFFSAVIVFGLFVSIALSWISGTGFFSETADQTETTRLTSSSEYQNNQQAQQRMRGEVEALAVSPDAVQAARAELARLHDQWEKAYAQRSTYFERDYTPKQVKNTADTWHNRTEKEVREVMKPLDDAMAEPQAIIDRAAQYQAKVSELERLQDVAPNANSGQAVLPVFESLGEWFEAQPQAVKVKVFVLTSIALELISGIGWLAWGMMGKPRQFTPEELALANYEQRAQRDMMRRAFDDIGSGSNHAGVIEATAEKNAFTESPTTHETAGGKASALPNDKDATAGNIEGFTESPTTHESSTEQGEPLPSESVDVLPIPEDGKRAVGGSYPCAHCGTIYTARTTWHKFCETCRTERKTSAMGKGAAQ